MRPAAALRAPTSAEHAHRALSQGNTLGIAQPGHGMRTGFILVQGML